MTSFTLKDLWKSFLCVLCKYLTDSFEKKFMNHAFLPSKYVSNKRNKKEGILANKDLKVM